MSGIDEQIPDDVVCPLCGGIPYFWILYPHINRTGKYGWYWLHSDKYLKIDPDSNKLALMKSPDGIGTTLKEIVCVVCPRDDGENHVFFSEHPTFREVLHLARRLER